MSRDSSGCSKLPRLYLSRPATVLPDEAIHNEAALSRVRESFRGSAAEWGPIDQSIRYVFDRCNTKMRYLDEDPALSPGEFAARAASACLRENGLAATDIDLLIYGGIARDAFEPATAAEVAGRLGAKPLHAMDVTCACAGLIEALHVAAGYFALHDDIQTALICAGELTRDRITHDMQSLEDVAVGVAGLTLGNAAAALLISREPLPAGSARLVGILHKTLAEHYVLCRAPIDGHFTSHSKELFALAVHVPPEIRRLLADAGWSPEEVDHYAFHQPSEAVLDELNVGELDALYNQPVIPANTFEFSFATPANFTAAVTEAQNIYNEGNTLLTDSANFMSTGDYTDAAMDHALAAMMVTEIPDEVLIVGQRNCWL